MVVEVRLLQFMLRLFVSTAISFGGFAHAYFDLHRTDSPPSWFRRNRELLQDTFLAYSALMVLMEHAIPYPEVVPPRLDAYGDLVTITSLAPLVERAFRTLARQHSCAECKRHPIVSVDATPGQGPFCCAAQCVQTLRQPLLCMSANASCEHRAKPGRWFCATHDVAGMVPPDGAVARVEKVTTRRPGQADGTWQYNVVTLHDDGTRTRCWTESPPLEALREFEVAKLPTRKTYVSAVKKPKTEPVEIEEPADELSSDAESEPEDEPCRVRVHAKGKPSEVSDVFSCLQPHTFDASGCKLFRRVHRRCGGLLAFTLACGFVRCFRSCASLPFKSSWCLMCLNNRARVSSSPSIGKRAYPLQLSACPTPKVERLRFPTSRFLYGPNALCKHSDARCRKSSPCSTKRAYP